MIKCSFEILKNYFVELFNLILAVGYTPIIWCKGLITPVHKNGEPTEPDNFRPICVLSCVCKFFTNVLNNRLTLVCKKEKLIHCSQIGFLENYRTTDHIFSLKTLLNKYTRGVRNGKVYSCFIDFKKAYDSVWHEGMYDKLESLNINGKFLEIIKNMYEKPNCAVKIQNKLTKFFQCKRGVRQGCPLSPILFNIYINDIAYKLEGINPAPLELPNGTLVSCLMYADDILILSRSPEGLQKLLDYTNIYCNKWKMTVNKSKTKCMTFSSKNKKNTKDLFAIGSCHLENVNEFTYLGLKIDAAGSLSASATMLSSKANKAKFALNNIAKLKQIPVKTAIYLFDAAVLPILTYCSEIWALNATLDHDKWDKTSTEQAHLNFIKHILGVNRSTNNLICRAELGRYPLSIEINTKIINFYRHAKAMPVDSIVHQSYLLDKNISQRHVATTLFQHIQNLGHVNNLDILTTPKINTKKLLKNVYNKIWMDKLRLTSRGKYCVTFKNNICYEQYLNHINFRNLRRVLTKLRLSDHNLMIEQGRKAKIKLPHERRTCKLCYNEHLSQIEDEIHFLFDCQWRKYIALRNNLIAEITSQVPQFYKLKNIQKFVYIMRSEDQIIVRKFSLFVTQMNKERETTMSL